MSRYCKERKDEAPVVEKKWFGGLDFPPPYEDYSRIKDWKTPRVYDRVENYKESDFNDMASDLSDVGEDEPIERGNKLWLDICAEHRRNTKRILDVYEELKRREEKRHCRDAPETEYIMRTVMPMLGPALEAMLLKASELDMLKRERTGYDPVDILAELLWNMNPRCPNRSKNYRSIFDIPPFKKWLRSHPRPDFPRHYFWNKVQSAICIQRNYRGYLVRRRENVQQLREFWRVLKGQKKPPETDPELTFGQDISGYKEHYPDLAKWNEEQQEKKKEAERIQWLKEEGLWHDEFEEEESDAALKKEKSHLLSHEVFGEQVQQLVDRAIEVGDTKQKSPEEIFKLNLSASIGN